MCKMSIIIRTKKVIIQSQNCQSLNKARNIQHKANYLLNYYDDCKFAGNNGHAGAPVNNPMMGQPGQRRKLYHIVQLMTFIQYSACCNTKNTPSSHWYFISINVTGTVISIIIIMSFHITVMIHNVNFYTKKFS